jgi:hypothetical protein
MPEIDQGPGPDATAEESARHAADNAWYAVNYANAQLATPPVAPSAAGGFLLDAERMRETIAELTRIADTVRQSMARRASLRFEAPGYDAVSLNLADAGRMMAGRAELFVHTWVGQIDAARDGLQSQLDAYLTTEADNIRRLA